MPPKRLKEEPPPPPIKPKEAEERAIYIREQIAKVEQYKNEGVEYETIKELVPDFVRDFPHLFLMVSSNDKYQKETLNTMLTMLDTMGTSVITQHDASIKVGQHLMENYITPDSNSTK